MNSSRFARILVLLTLAAAMLACSLLPATQNKPGVDQAVALTLTAIHDKALASDTPEPASATLVPASPTPTQPTPTETSTPLPTSTPEPVIVRTMQILYTDAGHNLWLWTESGGSTRLNNAGDILEGRLSPDGKLAAYIRSSDYQHYSLWVMQTDGQNQRQLVSPDDFTSMKNSGDAISAQPYVLEWLPNLNKLVFTTAPTFEGPGLMVNDDLWVVDAETAQLTAMLPPGQGGVFYFSPDGLQMALVRPTAISLVNLDGSNLRKDVLTYPEMITYSEYRYYAAPKWSPDSRMLRVAIPPKDPLADTQEPNTLWEIRTDGSEPRVLAKVESAPFLTPEFSPDLNLICYVTAASNNNRKLHIAYADGSNDQVYRSGDLNFRKWAPDSAGFVYDKGGTSTPQLGQIGIDPRALTDVDNIASIDWLNSGKVLLLHRTDNSYELRIGTPGGNSEVLVNINGDPDKYIPTYDVWD